MDLNLCTDVLLQWIREHHRTYVIVATVHTVMEAHDNELVRSAISGAGMVTPDGMPLVIAGKLRGLNIGRVYGPDLMLAIFARSTARGPRHFLYGGDHGVAKILRARLEARFPDAQIVGDYSPPFRPMSGDEEASVAEMINASGADIVWVGLGTPKQDLWMARMRPRLQACILVGVGAAFDFHAGLKPQAPKIMQDLSLEWLFRLICEPRRLWRRYLINNPRFLYHLAKQSLSGSSRAST